MIFVVKIALNAAGSAWVRAFCGGSICGFGSGEVRGKTGVVGGTPVEYVESSAASGTMTSVSAGRNGVVQPGNDIG